MGNNTSQPFEYEGGSQYRYHEAVLREAQRRAPPPPSVEYLSDEDEQFYSAEEDNTSRSVTPERERPESSSGGEQDSDNDSDEVETTSPESSRLNGDRGLLSSQHSGGEGNVSLARQDHYNISPELEAIARRGNSNSLSPRIESATGSQKRVLSCMTTPQQQEISPKRLKVRTRTSPFQPICSGIRQQRLIHRLSAEILGPAKRKIQSDNDEENVSPTKKALVKEHTKRVRLGYFDSSESEDSDSDRRGRSRRKRAKLSKNGSKRQRSDRHAASESSSEEDRHKRLRNSSRLDVEEDDIVSDSDNSLANQEKYEGSQVDGEDFHETVHAIPDDNEAVNGRLYPRGRTLRGGRQLPSVRSSNNANGIGPQSVSTTEERMLEIADHSVPDQKLCPLSASLRLERTVKKSDGNLRAELGECQSSEARQGHGKMGHHGVRNAQGKVLPVHQFRTPAVAPLRPPEPAGKTYQAPKTDNSAPPDTTPHTHVPNISKMLRRASGAFVRLQRIPPSLSQSKPQPDVKEDHGANSLDASQQNNDGIERKLQQAKITAASNSTAYSSASSKCGSSPAKRSLSDNPFENVELVPPSKSPHVLPETDDPPPINHPTDTASVGTDFMETDDSYKVAVNGVVFSPTEAKTLHAERPKLRAKRTLGKTVAERFRNFWTKKNIGSNLKSIFSKPVTSSPTSKFNHVMSGNKTVGLDVYNHASSDTNTHLLNGNGVNTEAPTVTFLTSEDAVRLPCVPSSSPASQSMMSRPADSDHAPTLSLPPPPPPPAIVSNRKQGQAGRRTSLRLSTPSSSHNSTSAPLVVKQLPQTSQFQALHVQLGGCLTVSVSLGELADQSADGLVNWTDPGLTHTVTECSRGVAARAGALVTAGCADYLENKDGPLEAPDVLITVAGGRFEPSVQAILHVVSPTPTGTTLPSRQRSHRAQRRGVGDDKEARSLLLQVYTNCLRFAEGKLRLATLALPLIGLGNFSIETCVQCFHESLLLFLHESGFPSSGSAPAVSLSSINLVIPDARTADQAAELLQLRLSGISTPETFSSAVSAVLDRSVKPSELKRHQIGSRETLSSSPPTTASETEIYSDQEKRTLSGRPRVKRPRF
ncbi:hypothetical protein ElyMa_001332300 [Elysia marginata]|uniref:Macro domain-containing protein n=1 Tax=Elysia marginata TaxID=1093978 RepID=A0AAV4IQ43_9GAST|nr:hypothetical protein ElyMa_001332300 [Elysia marginata]